MILSHINKMPIDIFIIEFVIYFILPPFIAQKSLTIIIGGIIGAYMLYLNYKKNISKIVIIIIALLFGIPNQGTESTGAMTHIVPTALLLIALLGFIRKIENKCSIFLFSKVEIWLLLVALAINIVMQGDFLLFYNVFIIGIIGIRLFFSYQELDVNFIFNNLRILFILQFLIIIAERFYGIKAYPSVMENLENLESLRCTGYTGHPLILSSFFIFYSLILFIQSYFKNKFFYIDTIVLILSCILLSSRTPLILITIVVLSNFFMFMRKKLLQSIIIVIIGIGSITYLISSTDLGDVFIDTTERITNATSEQRRGAFNIAKQLGDRNLVGIGLYSKDRLKQELGKGNIQLNSKFDTRAAVIDNSFLTVIISFGYGGLLLFVLYFSPIRRYIKEKKKIKAFIIPFIIALVFLLLNFSFDTIFYQHVIFLYFFVISYLYSADKNNIIQRARNNKIYTVWSEL